MNAISHMISSLGLRPKFDASLADFVGNHTVGDNKASAIHSTLAVRLSGMSATDFLEMMKRNTPPDIENMPKELKLLSSCFIVATCFIGSLFGVMPKPVEERDWLYDLFENPEDLPRMVRDRWYDLNAESKRKMRGEADPMEGFSMN